MIQLEIDSKNVEVPEGTMLIEAAKQAGCYVPHFCYHPKLSIAANCRMCLVEIEKAPKAMPACATPVTNGMKVFTQSEKVKAAQKSVMEFLLINHPLDCPICDQGGECQLQDLSVGYGKSQSRYEEEKRVVFHKNVGPLVSMQEMSRCIHCTRCVRFGQEIAGVMELGMVGRGEHSEITSFVGQAVSSELSGNMIDICPVGALTSKPFRYAARTWELSRRLTLSSHDALGSHLIAQVKQDKVMRVVPQTNEAINECWISDRDRFSYEGLYHKHRIQKPLLKDDHGQWFEATWEQALHTLNNQYESLKEKQEPHILGMLSPQQTLEEMYVFKQYLNQLGKAYFEFRFKQADLYLDEAQTPIGLNNIAINELDSKQAVLVVGSFLTNDHPLLAARLRKASKQGAQISAYNAISAKSWHMQLSADYVMPPNDWAAFWICVKQYLFGDSITVKGLQESQVQDAKKMANELKQQGEKQVILLGANVLYHPKRSVLFDVFVAISKRLQCKFGVLPDACNTLGAYHLEMYSKDSIESVNIVFNLGLDIEHDAMHSKQVLAVAKNAKLSVFMGSFISQSILDSYNIILPIATSFETSGSFVNMERKLQIFQGVTKPYGESRPAWKILKVLADLQQMPDFNFTSTEDIRQFIFAPKLLEPWTHHLDDAYLKNYKQHTPFNFERISYVPIYGSDSLVRHAHSLQETKQMQDAQHIFAHSKVLADKGLKAGDTVLILQGQQMLNATIMPNDDLSEKVILIPMTGKAAKELGAMFGDIAIEKSEGV